MRHKILIADDSLTIQKVIKITLANEPFDMDVCGTAQELTTKLQSYNPDIVLLDFNLSEDQTGYDLCRKVKSFNPAAKVFMLFGTFDTIDEDQLMQAGCDSKIVKPFDGTKFINTCRSLADHSSSELEAEAEEPTYDDEDIPAPIEEEEIPAPIEEEDEWVMDAPEHKDAEKPIEEPVESVPTQKSALDLEVEDWGMQVPGVIGENDSIESLDIPEVIDFSQAKAEKQEKLSEPSTALPSEEDLEFPDLSEISSDLDVNELEFSTGPKLTPMDDLNTESDSSYNEIDFDAPALGTNTEEELKRIEEQIQDEVGEDENLWSFDEVEEIPATESKSLGDDLPLVEPHKLKEVFDTLDNIDYDGHHARVDFEADEIKTVLQDFPDDLDFESKPAASSVPFKVDAEFEDKVRQQLEPLVEQYVKQYCQSTIEKIAWEIIPDLAENLIRKEIKRISDSILNP